jgi:hypothetical protein
MLKVLFSVLLGAVGAAVAGVQGYLAHDATGAGELTVVGIAVALASRGLGWVMGKLPVKETER